MWKVQENICKCLLYISLDILKYFLGGSSSRGYLGGSWTHLFSETQQNFLKKKKIPLSKKRKILSQF